MFVYHISKHINLSYFSWGLAFSRGFSKWFSSWFRKIAFGPAPDPVLDGCQIAQMICQQTMWFVSTGATGSALKAQGVIWERKFTQSPSIRPLTLSWVGAQLHRLADQSSDLRKFTKSGDKLMDLRVWGVLGTDLRAWGVIWQRTFIKLGDPVRPGPWPGPGSVPNCTD